MFSPPQSVGESDLAFCQAAEPRGSRHHAVKDWTSGPRGLHRYLLSGWKNGWRRPRSFSARRFDAVETRSRRSSQGNQAGLGDAPQLSLITSAATPNCMSPLRPARVSDPGYSKTYHGRSSVSCTTRGKRVAADLPTSPRLRRTGRAAVFGPRRQTPPPGGRRPTSIRVWPR